MKISNVLFATTFLIAAASSAQASVVNFSGSNLNMGTVVAGQSGTISNGASTSAAGSDIFATGIEYAVLPSDTEITFTYTPTNAITGTLYSFGSYDYTIGGKTYVGNSSAVLLGQPGSSGSTNGVASAPLVFASANVTSSEKSATAEIINTSSGIAQIESMFSALFTSTGRVASITYSVSAVPLPATLPMFAAVLAGLFGFSQIRKRRSV